MEQLNILLDNIKEMRSLASDNALAAAIGVKRQTVSNWRQDRTLPDAVQCATIAGLTGEPLAKVLGIVGEARAISREEKSVWRKLAASAAALFLASVATLPAAPITHAAQRDAQAQEMASQGYRLHIMRTSAWNFLSLIGDVARWLRRRFWRRPVCPNTIEAFAC